MRLVLASGILFAMLCTPVISSAVPLAQTSALAGVKKRLADAPSHRGDDTSPQPNRK